MRVCWHWPSATLHSLTVLSYDPVTSCSGSVGLNRRQETGRLPVSHKGQLHELLYASAPLRGGEGVGTTVTNSYFTTTEDAKGVGASPMSGESLLAWAVCHAPQFDGFVIRPRDELPRIRRVELEAGHGFAAIF